MAGFTNKVKYRILEREFEGGSLQGASYMCVLYTSTTAAAPTMNVVGDMAEIAAGNGYTAYGQEVAPSTGFDSLTENDTDHRAYVQMVDVTWTAAGGPIPASGGDAYYAGLTDKNATSASRELYYIWSLGADYSVSDTQELTIQDAEIRINES